MRRREWIKGRLPNVPVFRSLGKTELPLPPPILRAAPPSWPHVSRCSPWLLATTVPSLKPPLSSPHLTVYSSDSPSIISTVEWRLLCPQFDLWQIKPGTLTCHGSEARWQQPFFKGEDIRINMVTPSCLIPKVPLNCSILFSLFLIYFF